MEKLKTTETVRLREAMERLSEKKALLQQHLSEKMEKAEQLRETRIKEVVRKAKEEELKVEEVAFIKTLRFVGRKRRRKDGEKM